MDLYIIGFTFTTIGEIFVAVGILRVHFIMSLERSIDEIVLRSFLLEKILTYCGATLIVMGYISQLIYHGYGDKLLTWWL